MSNMIVNIRVGIRHFVIRRDSPRISFDVNEYWVKNKPTKWVCIYQIGDWYAGHD